MAIEATEEWVLAANRMRSLPARFDALFAVTWVLRRHDFWMNDSAGKPAASARPP